MDKMNILVTGGTGFMGTYLIPRLLEEGHNVRLIVRNSSKARQLYHNTCELIEGDIQNADSLKGCCVGIDIVYHMAALMGHDSPSSEAFEKFRKVNVEGVKNIVREAQKCNVKKFIHISSTAAMGLQRETYIDEKKICNPYTPYQVTKREGELIVLDEVKKNNFPAIIVRPSMVYGPGFKGDFLTIAKVCKTGFFPQIGSGKNLSPALYITDLCDALIRFIDKGEIGEIYLLSSKESYTLKETAEIIGKAINKSIKFIYIPKSMAIAGVSLLEYVCKLIGKKPVITKRNIQSVSKDRVINISKLMNTLEFEPQIPLKIGLPITIAYFEEQKYL